MRTLTHGELLELDCLIGDAREYARIVEILSDALIGSKEHEGSRLVGPIEPEDESALITAVQDSAGAARKLYKYFHETLDSE